nr:cyclin-dependent kinases regulatory subunit 2 isoform X1 [Pogona vitticeps]
MCKHTSIPPTDYLKFLLSGENQLITRHVMLPRELSKQVPKTHLMTEEEWRRLGVQQSLGWVHYMIHEPEPHILLFRRPLPKGQQK